MELSCEFFGISCIQDAVICELKLFPSSFPTWMLLCHWRDNWLEVNTTVLNSSTESEHPGLIPAFGREIIDLTPSSMLGVFVDVLSRVRIL